MKFFPYVFHNSALTYSLISDHHDAFRLSGLRKSFTKTTGFFDQLSGHDAISFYINNFFNRPGVSK